MKPTNFLFYQDFLWYLGSPLILWLSDHKENKIENNLMTASFVLKIQGVYLYHWKNIQATKYLCEVIFFSFLIWGQIYQECQESSFPIIPRTAREILAVKIQVAYFGVEMCLNRFEDFIIIEASSNVCHAMDNLTHRYCERVLNSVRDQTKDSTICGTWKM